MTKGIIQEVIDAQISIREKICSQSVNDSYVMLYNHEIQTLKYVKTKLIREIKNAEIEFAENENLLPVSWLIGDSQK